MHLKVGITLSAFLYHTKTMAVKCAYQRFCLNLLTLLPGNETGGQSLRMMKQKSFQVSEKLLNTATCP